MRVKCPFCEMKLSADDVNVQTMVAKCSACNHIFNFDNQINVQVVSPVAQNAQKKPLDMLVPKRVTVEYVDGGLQIRWRWFSYRFIPMACFCLFWNGFLLFWFGMALASESLLLFLVPIFHFAVGVWISYHTLAGLFNTTTITIRDGEVRVKHAPIPWKGSQTLATSSIKQLYLRETWENKSRKYHLHVLLMKNSKWIDSWISASSANDLLYIKQELERYLGIQTEHIRGEYEPSRWKLWP